MYPSSGVASLAQPMRRIADSRLFRWAVAHPVLTAFGLYLVLGVIFFAPGLVPGYTTSASDYLWSAAPWSSSIPSGIFHWSSHPLVVGSNTQLVDPTTVFEPFLQYTRSQLPHIPLWDPYIMGGTPFLGDMQSAIFSPFSLPAYILPFWWSLSFIAVSKVVVAAMGGFLLARALKMRFAGAFLCGTVYGFGLFMIAWLPWPLANVFPLIPWMLFATERLIRRPGVLSAAGLAVVIALQFFGGHPESSFQAFFAMCAFFLLRLFQGPGGATEAVGAAGRDGRSRIGAVYRSARMPVLAFGIAIVVGTAIAAVAILPFLELLRNSSDLSSRPRAQVYVQPRLFFASLLPGYFPGTYEIEIAFYAGALPLMLAVFAMFRARVERYAIAIFGILCIVVVLGVKPIFGFVGRLPGFDATYLSRLTIFYLLSVALLAGWGLDDLMAVRPSTRVARATGAVAAFLLVLPVVIVAATNATSTRFLGRAAEIAWAFAQRPLPDAANVAAIVHLASLLVWITVAGAAALLLYLRIGRRLAPSLFAVLALLLVVGDLFQAGMGENPAIPVSHAQQPVTPAIRFLQSQTPARFVAVAPYIGVNPLPPDVNIRFGLYDARGYDLPVITRFGELWSKYVGPPTPLLPLDTPAVPILNLVLPPGGAASLRVLSLLGVRDLLEQKGETPLQMPGVHLAYNGPDATIYVNDNALPRTWLVADQQVLKGDAPELDRVGSSGFDPRKVLLTAQSIPGLAEGVPNGPSPGQASITDYQAEKVTIDAHADRTSELVLSDTYYPGWDVTVNGKPSRIAEVDYLLRGVTVPAGNDRIVFTYDPASFRRGWIVSLVSSFALLVAVVMVMWRRRRRRRRRKGLHAHERRAESATQSGTL
jgi:Bacterial membrane protein YfhO